MAPSVPQPNRRATARSATRSPPRSAGTTAAASISCPPTKNAIATTWTKRTASQASTGDPPSAGWADGRRLTAGLRLQDQRAAGGGLGRLHLALDASRHDDVLD